MQVETLNLHVALLLKSVFSFHIIFWMSFFTHAMHVEIFLETPTPKVGLNTPTMAVETPKWVLDFLVEVLRPFLGC